MNAQRSRIFQFPTHQRLNQVKADRARAEANTEAFHELVYAALNRAVRRNTGAVWPKATHVIGIRPPNIILNNSDTRKLITMQYTGSSRCDALKLGNSLPCLKRGCVTLYDGEQTHLCRHHIDMINSGKYLAAALMVGEAKKYQVFKV